jgi:hypothetical protein
VDWRLIQFYISGALGTKTDKHLLIFFRAGFLFDRPDHVETSCDCSKFP